MKKSPKSKSASSPSLKKPSNILEKIDEKLDLYNILGKTMPVIILFAGSILWSLFYLGMNATVPEATTELPVTGEELEETDEFSIIYPENNSSISIPDKIIGTFSNESTTSYTSIKYYSESSQGEIEELGEAVWTGDEYYEISWTTAVTGRYNLWAEIVKEDTLKVKSASIIVDVE